MLQQYGQIKEKNRRSDWNTRSRPFAAYLKLLKLEYKIMKQNGAGKSYVNLAFQRANRVKLPSCNAICAIK